MIFPERDWIPATPESQGVDAEKMSEALRYLESYCGDDGLRETVIIRDGYLIYQGNNIDAVHNIWSSTKSFTSTALGLLVEDGRVSLDTVAAEYEPLLQEYYPQVTLRHFASMTSGYDAVGRSRWGDDSEDWSLTPFVPAKPLAAPGTAYCYWDEAMIMFGRVLVQILGRDLYSFLRERITDPIDLGDWSWWWEEQLGDIPLHFGGTGIEMSARQLARYGLLLLNNGNWNGRQVLAADWVEQATRVQAANTIALADTDRKNMDGRGAYGFNWWVNGVMANGTRLMPDAPPRTYYSSGLHNNMCFVVPEWRIVFVRMGQDGNPPEGKPFVYNGFLSRLGEAIRDM